MSHRRLLPLLTSLALWALAAVVAPAQAATTIDVKVGWGGGMVRAGRWTPILVTASDDKPRNVALELYAPHDGVNVMRVRQELTLNPQPVTVALYAPLVNYTADELSVTVRNPATNKVLARWPDPDAALAAGQLNPMGMYGRFLDANTRLVGVSGQGATMRTLERQLQSQNGENKAVQLSAAYMELALLPFAPVGYDSVDLLVLNAPDFAKLDDERQQAIVDWVRSGGCLLVWPGENPVPERGPLLDVLPARVGGHANVEFDPKDLERLGLGRRFRSLKGRVLTATPGATALPIFGSGGPPAFRSRLGFGEIFLAPVDLGQFQFDTTEHARAFWNPLLQPAFAVPHAMYDNTMTTFAGPQMLRDQRQAVAVESLANRLADVPGVGRFDFTYVAVVLVGMMLVVGPIDWFVLKRIGRQPWTWVTTSGWIALVTVGAVFIGHWLRSGDLHYRTVRLVEQADGRSVATTDLVSIYSPKTDEYAIASAPDVWWEPVSPAAFGYRRELTTDWRFHQTYRGNQPLGMTINVWNVRFLRGQTVAPGDAVIEANLTLGPPGEGGRRTISGTLTNRGPAPLNRVIVQTKDGAGVANVQNLPTGETTRVSAVLDPAWMAAQQQAVANESAAGYGRYAPPPTATTAGQPAVAAELSMIASDLSARGALRVEQLLRDHDDLACIYATGDVADPAVKLPDHQPVQQHRFVVRALVPVGRSGP